MLARLLILAAGLCGAAGVALSAVAAHGGAANTATAATFLVVHAPVLLVVDQPSRTCDISELLSVTWVTHLV